MDEESIYMKYMYCTKSSCYDRDSFLQGVGWLGNRF